jgi:hypothetical protein
VLALALVLKLWYPRGNNPRKFANRPALIKISPNSRKGGYMDRRRSARVSVQLPVNVWGVDAFGQAFSLPAMVTSLSANGVVVQGVRRRVRIGDTLDLRMGSCKGQFRLIWIGDMSEMGLERIDGNSFLPASPIAQFAQSAASC